MPRASTIVFSVIGIYLLSLVVKNVSSFIQKRPQSFTQEDISLIQTRSEPSQSKYKFNNPGLAYKVLSQLDIFTPVDGPYHNFKQLNEYDQTLLSIIKEDYYCEKHRAYITAYPEAIFDQINFMTDYPVTSLYRVDVARVLGNDVNFNIVHNTQEEQRKPKYTFKPETNSFFTPFDLHLYMYLGKHFSCLSQESNHIPGNAAIFKKDYAAISTKEYAKTFADRPQCFNFNKFFPKTYLLNVKEDCEEFFAELNSPRYAELKAERKVVYIGKEGSGGHRGETVSPIFDEDEEDLKEIFLNGLKCGTEDWNYLIQHYVHNPLLLNNHKFDFRMYMLIASSNPLIAYYHDGFLRVTLATYDKNSKDKNSLLTNLALNKQIMNDAANGKLYEGMNEEQLLEAQQWTMERLQDYLLEKGFINDTNWLDNYLRPEFKKAMVHLTKMASSSFLKTSSVYELYGVDFILDDNLNLWFLEANVGPSFSGKYTQPIRDLKINLLRDHLRIVMGLMRSRMLRVLNYVNKLLDEGIAEKVEGGDVVIHDLEARRREFDELIKNRFEKEFEPSNTGFSKIIDENLEGVERYQGFIAPECL